MPRDWIALLIFFGICFAVAAIGSVFTARSVKTWYPGLLKPRGTPPPRGERSFPSQTCASPNELETSDAARYIWWHWNARTFLYGSFGCALQ